MGRCHGEAYGKLSTGMDFLRPPTGSVDQAPWLVARAPRGDTLQHPDHTKGSAARAGERPNGTCAGPHSSQGTGGAACGCLRGVQDSYEARRLT